MSDGDVRFDPALPGTVVRELAARAGSSGPIIDLTGCLRASGEGDDLYYGTNTHWSVRGNELVGQWLAANLDRAWFDTPRDPSHCDTAPPRATGGITDAIDSNSAGFPVLLAFESTAMASLLEPSFGSIEEVFRQLERLGYRQSSDVGGAFLVRPAYMTPMTHLAGWVTNERAPNDPAFVVFFREGRLQSVGRTVSPEADAAQNPSQLRFRTRIRGKSLQIGRDGDLWGIAISDGGLFGPLAQREKLDLPERKRGG